MRRYFNGARLRQLRIARGLLQSEVAEELFVARTTYVAIEQNRRPIHEDQLDALCKLYGVDRELLLMPVENMKDELTVQEQLLIDHVRGNRLAEAVTLVAEMLRNG